MQCNLHGGHTSVFTLYHTILDQSANLQFAQTVFLLLMIQGAMYSTNP